MLHLAAEAIFQVFFYSSFAEDKENFSQFHARISFGPKVSGICKENKFHICTFKNFIIIFLARLNELKSKVYSSQSRSGSKLKFTKNIDGYSVHVDPKVKNIDR